MAPAAPATPAVAAGSEGRGLLAMVVVVLEGAAEDRLPPEAAVVAVVEFVDDLGAGVGLDGGCDGLAGAAALRLAPDADDEGELLALPPESD